MTEDQNTFARQPVSFVLPAHNESGYLPQTLKALHSAAQSNQIEYEIIVVNDASTDNTRDIALASSATVIDVSLRNIGAVRNAGAQCANHPWLIFLDADTILPAETLTATLSSLASGDVGGGAFVKISREKKLPIIKLMFYWGVVIGWQYVGRWAAGCYMFCQKSHFEDFGGFDENYFAAEELFFSRALKSRGKFTLVKIPVITSARKLHSYSTAQLFRFLLRPLLAGRNALRSRVGLEVLYEDKR